MPCRRLRSRAHFAVQNVGRQSYIVRTTESEVTLYSTASHGQLGRWARKGVYTSSLASQLTLAHAAAEVVSGKAGFAVRIAEITAGGELSLIRNGETQWLRPEMLAYATIASWVDDGSRDTLMEELRSRGLCEPCHCLRSPTEAPSSRPRWSPSTPFRSCSAVFWPQETLQSDAKQRLVGDKTVIVGTSRKDLIAVDTSRGGNIIWQSSLASTLEVKMQSFKGCTLRMVALWSTCRTVRLLPSIRQLAR